MRDGPIGALILWLYSRLNFISGGLNMQFPVYLKFGDWQTLQSLTSHCNNMNMISGCLLQVPRAVPVLRGCHVLRVAGLPLRLPRLPRLPQHDDARGLPPARLPPRPRQEGLSPRQKQQLPGGLRGQQVAVAPPRVQVRKQFGLW